MLPAVSATVSADSGWPILTLKCETDFISQIFAARVAQPRHSGHDVARCGDRLPGAGRRHFR